MGLDVPAADAFERREVEGRTGLYCHFGHRNEAEQWMALRLADGVEHVGVRGQHPLDRLGIHKPPAAAEDAVEPATKVEPPLSADA